jgi:hypothetical protein
MEAINFGMTRDHLLANTYQATTPTNLDMPLWLSCSVGHTEMQPSCRNNLPAHNHLAVAISCIEPRGVIVLQWILKLPRHTKHCLNTLNLLS